jgi:hypothetical protein
MIEEVAAIADLHSSCVSTTTAVTGRPTAASLEKIPTTLVVLHLGGGPVSYTTRGDAHPVRAQQSVVVGVVGLTRHSGL